MADVKDPLRAQMAVRKGMDAFWAEIARQYPEIKTGDLPINAEDDFYRASLQALRWWVDANAR